MAEDRQARATRDPPDAASLKERVAQHLDTLLAAPLTPALYVVATPIGHLSDITLRALAVLQAADLVYCEDTRHSRTLLESFGLSRRLRPYHEHNAEQERPRILGALAEGRSVALISDAGTPLISDPGFKLARSAIDEGRQVISIPGASATLAALTSSGLPSDAFLFAGFLPAKSAGRRARLAELAAVPATLIFFEAPSRLADSLADMAATLGGTREGAIARELTKRYEEVKHGSLDELVRWAVEVHPRGEMVVLVSPPTAREVGDEEIAGRLAEALAAMSVRDASKTVAEALGVAKARVYDLALRLKRGGT